MVIPIAVASVTALTLIGLRVRAVLKKKTELPKEALNNPNLRPPPPEDPKKREEVQKETVQQVLAAPPPERVFKVGEIIGVDLFSSGIAFSQFPAAVMNFKIVDLGNDNRILLAIPADKRIFVDPALNQLGKQVPFPIARNAIRPFPDPEGGLTGVQGAPILAVDDPSSFIQIRLDPVPKRTFRGQEKGDDVKAWQAFLLAKGFNPGVIDGHYGTKTIAATKEFQKANGLVVDGIAGPKTFAAAAP